MLRCDRDALRRNFVVLVREVPCTEVLSSLYQDGILNQQMVTEILEEPPSKRNYSLLFLLQMRGPAAFASFLNALKETKRTDLANLLTNLEDEFTKVSI